MKKILKPSLAALALALVSGASFAQTGISATPHNLTSTGPAGANKQSTTEQICVFCHTPHAANTAVSAPLWNKNNPATSYSVYSTANSSTIDGNVLAVGSVSAACLSCHDGTQAMDNIINAPGSGGYAATGGGADGLGYAWTGSRVDPTGKMTNAGGFIANLGADLTNDHPIGIQYCGGGLTGSGNTVNGTCNDLDFVRPVTRSINNTQVFWVDTTNNRTRSKNDIILYTRTFTGGATGPSVECASCHDPHTAAGAPGGAADVNFMRVTTAGSKICLACHVK